MHGTTIKITGIRYVREPNGSKDQPKYKFCRVRTHIVIVRKDSHTSFVDPGDVFLIATCAFRL
jgi:hypothetical protein